MLDILVVALTRALETANILLKGMGTPGHRVRERQEAINTRPSPVKAAGGVWFIIGIRIKMGLSLRKACEGPNV